MKCIHCDHDSKYKERADGKCPGCHHAFAFEPRKGAKMTDMAFKRAVDVVSADGHVRWGVEHLYYEICRRMRRRGRARRIAALVALGLDSIFFLIAVINAAWIWAAILLVIGAMIFWQALRSWTRTVVLTQDQFDAMWKTWQRVHRDLDPKGVIVRKPPSSRPRPAEPDIGLYSFDRAVICDRARTVDLLLANNFHFENNCAVLSIDGYPPGPFAMVREMLKRNPRLQVFALHDATGVGCRMPHRLANEPEWFREHARVVDVGLRPAQARVFSGLLLPAHGEPLHAGPGLTDLEAQWLSKYTLEIAAIRPEQVLKRLYRAINKRVDDSGGGDGGGIGGDGASSSGDAAGGFAPGGGDFGGAGASGGWGTDGDSMSGEAGDGDSNGDGDGTG